MRLHRPAGFAGFTTLWLGQVLSALGTRMTTFAVSIWVWQETGDATALTLLVFFAFGGTVIFSPIAGALIDRWNRRLTLALSDAGSALATVTMLVLFVNGSPEMWQLYVLNAVTGIFVAFQMPAYSATITLMVEKGQYPRANAMMFAVRSAPVIFAPGLAGALLSVTSIEAILIADAVTFLFAFAAVFAVAIPELPKVAGAKALSLWQDSLFGIRYIWRKRPLAAFEGLLFAINLFAAIGFVLLVPLILARGGSAGELGAVQTIGAVGGVAGVVLLAALKPTPNKMLRILIAILIFSVVGRIVYGVGETLVLWAIALVFVHLCIPMIDGYAQSIWQEKVPPGEQGRVFAARQLIEDLTVPIAAVVAGPVVDYVLEPWMQPGEGGAALFGAIVGTGDGAGMGLTFVVIGVLGTLVTVAGFAFPSIRRLETIIPDHDAVEPVAGDFADDLSDLPDALELPFATNGLAASSAPDEHVSNLRLLDEAEWRQFVIATNDTATAYPRTSSVHELFEQWADRTPDAPALECGELTLSYGELDRRANQLAHRLRRVGVDAEARVGLCLRSTADWVIGALATLKAGGAYVPLDPTYPRGRLAHMCGDSRLRAVVLTADLADALPPDCGERLLIDELRADLEQEPSNRLAQRIDPDRLAYVMYTSGSTGRPKGVAVTHRNVVRLVRDTEYGEIGAADTVAQASNISFDAATYEAWGALLNGARLVAIELEDLLVPERLRERLLALRVDVLFLTTALARQIAIEAPAALASVRHFTFGGERADRDAVIRMLQSCPETAIVNAYGPTEGTTFTTTHRCDERELADADAVVPIGTAVTNTTTYVLDHHLQPVAPGVVGELYTGGDGVARGYLDDPRATATRFVPDPFASELGQRLYRTGDLVRQRRDGALEFVGRVDDQVKVRGFRVEPSEIEHSLRRSGLLRDVVVRVDHVEGGDARLVAYVVADVGHDVDDVRDYARSELPEYMLPAAFVALTRLPLNPNGKVDANALPSVASAAGDERSLAAPRTATEAALVAIWCEVLGSSAVGLDDSFFELGGRSLGAMRVRSRLSAVLGVDVPLELVFEHATVATLAAAADEFAALASAPRLTIPPTVAAAGEQDSVADLLEQVENAATTSLVDEPSDDPDADRSAVSS